jgi:hypothetical protein
VLSRLDVGVRLQGHVAGKEAVVADLGSILGKRFGRKFQKFGQFFKGCPGWGANPGSFYFVYVLIPSLYR